MAEYVPVTMYKGGDTRVAETVREYVELIFDGWTAAGPAPDPSAFSQRQLDELLATIVSQLNPLPVLREAAISVQREGAKADSTTNDSPAFAAALARTDVSLVRVPTSTPDGASTPYYRLASTFDLPSTKSLQGDGYRTRLLVPASAALTNNVLIRCNTTAAGGYVVQWPNIPASKIGNFIIQNGGPTAGLIMIQFSGNQEFENIYAIRPDIVAKNINHYVNHALFRHIYTYEKMDSANYAFDINGSSASECIVFEQMLLSNDATTYRPKHIRVHNANGLRIHDISNGDIYLKYCRAAKLSVLHMENGVVTFDSSSGEIEESLFYMRGYSAWKTPPLVVNQETLLTSLRAVSLTVRNSNWVYNDAFADGYAKDGTANFLLTGNGAPLRGIVRFENCARLILSRSNQQNAIMVGITGQGETDFNNYSHIASVDSSWRQSYWHIASSMPSLPTPTDGIATIGTSDDSRFTGTTATYYYKAQFFFDKKRRIGVTGPTERSVALTNGGNGADLNIESAQRQAIMVRLYRGTASGMYDKYVDVPLISGGRLWDNGTDVMGFVWNSRTPGPVDSINWSATANAIKGFKIEPGDTAATSDAFGRAITWTTYAAGPPTVGAARSGDRVEIRDAQSDGTGVVLAYRRITDCTEASPAHAVGTDWIKEYAA